MALLRRSRLTVLICLSLALSRPTPAWSSGKCTEAMGKLGRFSVASVMLATALSAFGVWALQPTIKEKLNQSGAKAYIGPRVASERADITEQGAALFSLAEFRAAAPQLASLARKEGTPREITGFLRYWAKQDRVFSAKLNSAAPDLNEWVRGLKKATGSGVVSPLDELEVKRLDGLLAQAYGGIAGQLDLSASTTDSAILAIITVGMLDSYRALARDILDGRMDVTDSENESSRDSSLFMVALAQERMDRGEPLPDAFVTAFVQDVLPTAPTQWPPRLEGESDPTYVHRVFQKFSAEGISATPNPDARLLVEQIIILSAVLESKLGAEKREAYTKPYPPLAPAK